MMKGFTLLELLVVIALVGMLTVGSYMSFGSYSKSQGLQTSVADVTQVLNLAKSRSLAQVKPAQCGVQVLQGYQVSVTISGTIYRLEVVCGTNTYTIDAKTLASPLTFANSSANKIFFAVSTAVVNTPGNIVLTGGSQNKTIRVDESGKISVQ